MQPADGFTVFGLGLGSVIRLSDFGFGFTDPLAAAQG